MLTARNCAFSVLVDVVRDKAYANLSLQQTFRKHQLDVRDKGLCSEIVYGTLQRQRTLDALLGQVCNKSLSDLELEILTILRMSLYQLEFLDKVPVYAVLNEAVELTKRHQRRASGFVNGVLRGYLRDKRTWQEKLSLVPTQSEADKIGLELSYPTWIVERLINAYGKERTVAILSQSNRKSHLTLRVNTVQTNREEIMQELGQQGLTATASDLSPVGVRLNNGVDVDNWDLFQDGKVTIQDEGAMLIAPLTISSEADTKVLDMCAAPGTKTTHLAELMRGKGTVLAADLHPHKVKLIQQGAARLNLTNIQTMAVDARLLPQLPGHKEAYDAVLLDAPCSGFGVMRHRPDIRWRRQESDVAQLATLQVQLLEAAVQLVKPGGVIVYATCTLLPQENEQVVEAVVEKLNGLISVEPLAEALSGVAVPPGTTPGFTLTPDLFDTDGFYMCRLKKQPKAQAHTERT